MPTQPGGDQGRGNKYSLLAVGIGLRGINNLHSLTVRQRFDQLTQYSWIDIPSRGLDPGQVGVLIRPPQTDDRVDCHVLVDQCEILIDVTLAEMRYKLIRWDIAFFRRMVNQIIGSVLEIAAKNARCGGAAIDTPGLLKVPCRYSPLP